jgi:hypothetical protein
MVPPTADLHIRRGSYSFPTSPEEAHDLPVRCTCPVVWHAIVPPPPCPVHGQAQMPIISCST